MLFTVTFQGYYPSVPAVGYTLYNADGTVQQARTTTGVINPVGMFFQVSLDVAGLTAPFSIVWDDANGNYAGSAYNAGGGGTSTVIIVNDNLTCGM